MPRYTQDCDVMQTSTIYTKAFQLQIQQAKPQSISQGFYST